jgi:SH3-like domain-containing protein
MRKWFLLWLILAGPVWAEEAKPSVSGLAVPRFVSLKADKVHLRVGPGRDYPIEWTYVKRGLPVEIIAEYDVWRKLRDFQGTEGWVHQQRLSGRRTAMVTADLLSLFRRPENNAPILAKIQAGVVVRLLSCQPQWCRIEADGFRGFAQRDGIWGVYPSEQAIEE